MLLLSWGLLNNGLYCKLLFYTLRGEYGKTTFPALDCFSLMYLSILIICNSVVEMLTLRKENE